MTHRGTIILDRDGVLNEVIPDYVKSIDELFVLDSSVDAIKKLLGYGFGVVVASNQAGVSKNLISKKTLSDIEKVFCERIQAKIEFFYCTHLPSEGCSCRKPKTGLIDAIQSKYQPPFTFVGDNITDFQAANRSNIDFILVCTGHGLKFRKILSGKCSIYPDLLSYVNSICKE